MGNCSALDQSAHVSSAGGCFVGDSHGVAAGIRVSGTNAEVMPGQWECQVGPLGPVEVADHLWMARWLMERIAAFHGVAVRLDPKPVDGDWMDSHSASR